MTIAAGALVDVAATGACASETSDAAHSGHWLDDFIRIRARPDGRPVFWAYSGTLFGRLETEPAVALMNVVGVGIDQTTPHEGGGCAYKNSEVGYFTDLQTGAPLGDWTNPLNGAVCQIKPYKSSQQANWRPDLSIETILAPQTAFDVSARGAITPPKIQGDSLWMSEDLFLKATPKVGQGPQRRPMISTSLATFHARVADLRRPGRGFITAQLYYTTLGSWRPAMKMGDTPGVLSWRMTAEKAATPSLVPADVKGWIARDYPGFLNQPSI